MKKIIFNFFLILLLIFSICILILSTIGVETKRFNNLVSKKIYQTNKNVSLKLNTIKFKLDVNEVSLFLETLNPEISYRKVLIPAKNLRVYIDFFSLIKSEPKVKKINLVLEELDVNKLKKIITIIKPSNFQSLVTNVIKKGKFSSEFEFYLDKNNSLKNFITKGTIKNLYAEISNDIILKKTNFSFFADKTDILIKNIFGELDSIKITDGDLRLNLEKEISLKSNFLSNLSFNNKSSIKYFNLLKNYKFPKNIINFEANLNNNLAINFDETYKIKNYNFTSSGKILKANLKFKKPISNYFLEKDINEMLFINSKIKTNLSSNKNNTKISGKYSINNGDLLNYDVNNDVNKNLLKLDLNLEYNNEINLELINYHKSKGSIANFSVNLEKKKNNLTIKKINLNEEKNSILLEDLKFNKREFLSFKKISVNTNTKGKNNNKFNILLDKKIMVQGSQFDATNLPKILSQKTTKNIFDKINAEIEIDFNNIIAPLSENLKNFKLIGSIKRGKFTKISSKGDLGNNNYLDISMKNDKKNKKKYLEIYSDLPQLFLTQYNFFKGLAGGKLLYTSIIESGNSNFNSKLKIENFKLVNAPGMVKLLSLADLGGLADLAEGEGLSFNVLEINMEKYNGFLNLNEIYALGPSISVLMEGYQDQNGITSLRGTLIPAKNLNNLISKIPILGDIIIPKEVGEGLFGISFKMKGPPGKIKTSINPIKTLTPRFIQKIIKKNKNFK